MADIRPYIARKLREMRETGEPVWVSIKGKRCKCVPLVDVWELGNMDDIALTYGGWFLVKNKGKYHAAWVKERAGRAYTFLDTTSAMPFYMSLENILARIEEIHPVRKKET